MARKMTILALVLVVLASMAMSVSASKVSPIEPLSPAPSAETGEMIDESPHLWFIELKGKPTSEGGRISSLASEKANLRTLAASQGIRFTERFAFSSLWNGISMSIQASDLAKISRMPGVKAVYPVVTIAIPETEPVSNPDLVSALAMTGADIAQSELGFTGKGIKVAIMDTGVDYNHPDLGGCFGPGCRVEMGWDFVGNSYNADPSTTAYNPIPTPDPDPDDCNGHGSHVAGIVGANGAIVGVAPEVTFGAYRVFGCQGSTTADIMLAAMERALADGMQVLNMSIGSAFQWPQYPTAMAANRMVNRGMVVVASIGNSGTSGVYAAGAPGLGKDVIGVASFDNTFVNLSKATISPDGYGIGYANAAGSPPAPLSGTLPMARTGTQATTNDGCSALPAGSLSGHIALIRRGTCTFYIKAANAMNAGAAAVALYNNAAGRFSPTVAGAPAITIPVVAISGLEGNLIDSRLAAGPVDWTWTDESLSVANPTGGLVSDFSSYGLAPDLSLKPDIGAPGGMIRSTYPLEAGGYATISGTSMSSPHVAGAVALLLQAKPGTPSNKVRDILQNSADPALWWGNPGLGFLDQVHRQGAGMLDIDDAILAKTYIKPGKLALGESTSGPSRQKITIQNQGKGSNTYSFSYVNALSTSGVITPSAWDSDAVVEFSTTSVTIPAGGAAAVYATITPATYPANGQYGGYIVITDKNQAVFRVPFAGFVGDYQGIVHMLPTSNGFPWLSKLTACSIVVGNDCTAGGSYTNQSSGATYSMVGTDIPYILVHLEHQVARMQMELFDLTLNKTRLLVYDEKYLGRNSTSSAFFAFPWDGWTYGGPASDGQYTLTVKVLKALGDPANPADWESWTSPVITIDRP